MPIDMLMQHLKDTKKIMNIRFREGIIKNVKIEFYQISNDQLYIYMDKCHELWIDISDFEKVKFDALAFDPQNRIGMQRCLSYLKKTERFNTYLVKKNDEFFLDFLDICDGNNLE